MAAGDEWIDIAIKAAIALSGGIGGLFIGVWKWGRSSGKAEAAGDAKISALREEMRTSMATQATKSEARTDLLVEQFKETFDGIRRQIDEHRYYTEKDFLKKEDFKDFREEYREDMRDLKASIAGIARTS
jgi:hypothetical protein